VHIARHAIASLFHGRGRTLSLLPQGGVAVVPSIGIRIVLRSVVHKRQVVVGTEEVEVEIGGGGQETVSVGCQDHRPDVLARLHVIDEEGAGAVNEETLAIQPEQHLVRVRPAD